MLIRTEAIGVNYVDVQLRRGTFPDSIYFRSLPATLTGDVVGIIEKAGPEAETGRLRIATTTLPLAEAVQAHRLLEDRTVVGRLILQP